MKKVIIRNNIFFLTFLFFAFSTALAQESNTNDSCAAFIQKELADKIQGYKIANLLPYYDTMTEKWGMMDKTGNKLTIPISNSFYDLTFSQGLYVSISFGNVFRQYKINPDDFSVKLNSTWSGDVGVAPDSRIQYLDSAVGFKMLKDGGVMLGKKYYKGFYTNLKPFQYNGKYYLIVADAKTKKYGIIDEEGKVLNGFDFNYNTLRYYKPYKDHIWFYFDDGISHGFKDPVGKIKFKNEFDRLLGMANNFLIVGVSHTNKFGIVDLKSMKWVMHLQEKYYLDNAVVKKYIQDGKEMEEVYFIIISGKEQFLMDENQVVYKLLK